MARTSLCIHSAFSARLLVALLLLSASAHAQLDGTTISTVSLSGDNIATAASANAAAAALTTLGPQTTTIASTTLLQSTVNAQAALQATTSSVASTASASTLSSSTTRAVTSNAVLTVASVASVAAFATGTVPPPPSNLDRHDRIVIIVAVSGAGLFLALMVALGVFIHFYNRPRFQYQRPSERPYEHPPLVQEMATLDVEIVEEPQTYPPADPPLQPQKGQ